jgi:positive regulator of sigma E activity
MYIIFSIMWMTIVQILIIWINSIKWSKFTKYSKQFEKYAKIEHVVLRVVTQHKKFGSKKNFQV